MAASLKSHQVLGSAFRGKVQKRYRHKKDYTFFKGDKQVGCLKIDLKLSDEELREELLEFKEMCGADKCFITWTALEGFCKKEVVL